LGLVVRQFFGSLVGWLTRCLFGSLVVRSLVGWLVGWLVVWLVRSCVLSSVLWAGDWSVTLLPEVIYF
jgi:hypothetical protein